MFIASYTAINLFREEIYFFKCLYFRKFNIWMSLNVFWLRKGPWIKYVRKYWGMGAIQIRAVA